MMTERSLIASILSLTLEKSTSIKSIKNSSRLPLDVLTDLLENLQAEGLLKLTDSSIILESENRLKLALKAISMGGDVQTVSNFLKWQEFESITAGVLKGYGYDVTRNLRFKSAARKWEIDVIGCKKPLVICVDCKDFHHCASPSAMNRIVEKQVERVRALVNALPTISFGGDCVRWNMVKFVPVIMVLLPSRFKFCEQVPIVPVLQLRDFLQQLPFEVESLKYFLKKFAHLSDDL